MPTQFEPLASARLILRKFQTSDVAPFHAYRSDPAIAHFQGWNAFTLDDAEAFVARQRAQEPGALGVGAQIAIELTSSGEMIGDVYLNTSDDKPHTAQIGYTLASRHQRHGYATEAVETLLHYVFGTLNKHRVAALTFADNLRSVALLERVGMRKEAHHTQSSQLDGAWVDDAIYAMLQDEWRSRARQDK